MLVICVYSSWQQHCRWNIFQIHRSQCLLMERTVFGLVCSYFQIKLIVLSGYWILCHCCYYYLRRFWISITQDEAVLAGSSRDHATFRTWSRSIKQLRTGSLHGSCYRYKVALWVAVGIQRFRWRSDLLIRMHEIAIRLNVNGQHYKHIVSTTHT